MNYNKKTVKDLDVKGKKVLCRCDFNVPQDKATGAITDDKRIVAALPTLKYLLEQGAAVIACSHLGKPKGERKESLTLAPVAKRLSELLGCEVIFANDTIGEDAKAKAAALQPGQIMLLENLRFDIREEKNDPEFAKALADMAEVYVSDAFGTVHRAHASTAGVAAYLPAVSGFLIEKELEIMGGALANPKRPLVAILGGAKVSSFPFFRIILFASYIISDRLPVLTVLFWRYCFQYSTKNMAEPSGNDGPAILCSQLCYCSAFFKFQTVFIQVLPEIPQAYPFSRRSPLHEVRSHPASSRRVCQSQARKHF